MSSKKWILGLFAGYLLSCTPASAQLVIQPIINAGPPAYVAPAPYPYYAGAPYIANYDPHHRWHDRRYWHDAHGHDAHGRR